MLKLDPPDPTHFIITSKVVVASDFIWQIDNKREAVRNRIETIYSRIGLQANVWLDYNFHRKEWSVKVVACGEVICGPFDPDDFNEHEPIEEDREARQVIQKFLKRHYIYDHRIEIINHEPEHVHLR